MKNFCNLVRHLPTGTGYVRTDSRYCTCTTLLNPSLLFSQDKHKTKDNRTNTNKKNKLDTNKQVTLINSTMKLALLSIFLFAGDLAGATNTSNLRDQRGEQQQQKQTNHHVGALHELMMY
jgi:hypothetical protein